MIFDGNPVLQLAFIASIFHRSIKSLSWAGGVEKESEREREAGRENVKRGSESGRNEG